MYEAHAPAKLVQPDNYSNAVIDLHGWSTDIWIKKPKIEKLFTNLQQWSNWVNVSASSNIITCWRRMARVKTQSQSFDLRWLARQPVDPLQALQISPPSLFNDISAPSMLGMSVYTSAASSLTTCLVDASFECINFTKTISNRYICIYCNLLPIFQIEQSVWV